MIPNPLDYLASQLRRPTGLFGELVISRLYDRVGGHKLDLTLELLELELEAEVRVLEVGFGGGDLLDRVQRRVAGDGFVAGVDLSEAMVAHCRRRFADRLAPGRFELVRAGVDDLPYPDGSFDRVCSVSTIYFWEDLDRALAELRRILAPGGRLLITFTPRAQMEGSWVAGRGYRLHEPGEVQQALQRAGLERLRIARREHRKGPFCCALGHAPPA